MSLPLKSIHVRITPEAHAALRCIAEAERRDLVEVAEHVIEESLLGKIHSYRLALDALSRSGTSGRDGD